MFLSFLKRVMPSTAKNFYLKSWKQFFLVINSLSPSLATQLLHYKTTGKKLNLNNPVDFNEKLQWIKLYDNNPLTVICADKYEMYKYVEENGDANILNNLLGVYDSTNEIDWESLPEKFAIKCNHGCGYNIVTNKKSDLDKNDTFLKLEVWLKEKFGRNSLEYHYDKIIPKIIVEEYIENKEGLLPLDYKIYCFNGKAKVVLVCSERESSLKLDFFDLEWNRLNIGHKYDESDRLISKPSCFDIMIKSSEELSKNFLFVRIDFYDKDGVAVLGEFTFTPASNMATYYNQFGLEFLGDMLKLPM